MSTHRRPDVADYYLSQIGAAVPRSFGHAVHTAVRARGGTMADYVRLALSEQLTRDGVRHDRPAVLDRTTFLHPKRIRAI